jgi:hypothetical protein
LLTIKNNVVEDAISTPNISFEIVAGQRISFEVEGLVMYKPLEKKWKAFALISEVKYWLSGRVLSRFYMAPCNLITTYRIHRNDEYHNGDAIGVGLVMGYVFPLSSRWNVEASIGGVYAHYWEDKTSFGTSTIRQSGWLPIPTKVGISIGYVIK